MLRKSYTATRHPLIQVFQPQLFNHSVPSHWPLATGRHQSDWVCPDLVFTVKEFSTEGAGGAMVQMKNFVEESFGTNMVIDEGYGPQDMGKPMSNMEVLPSHNEGREVTTLRFKPKSADSYLFIEGQ